MERLQKLEKALENIERRKRNTQKGKEKVLEVVKLMNEIFNLGDGVIRRLTDTEVDVVVEKYDYRDYEYFQAYSRLQIWYVDGEFVLTNSVQTPKITQDTKPEEIIYINFSQFVKAIEEAVETLSHLRDWDDELCVLNDIVEILRKFREK